MSLAGVKSQMFDNIWERVGDKYSKLNDINVSSSPKYLLQEIVIKFPQKFFDLDDVTKLTWPKTGGKYGHTKYLYADISWRKSGGNVQLYGKNKYYLKYSPFLTFFFLLFMTCLPPPR